LAELSAEELAVELFILFPTAFQIIMIDEPAISLAAIPSIIDNYDQICAILGCSAIYAIIARRLTSRV
jgi:hypothetical protein